MGLTRPLVMKYTLALLIFLVLIAAFMVTRIDLNSHQQTALDEPPISSTIPNNSTLPRLVQTSPQSPRPTVEKNNNEMDKLKQEQAALSKKFDEIQSNLRKLQENAIVELSDDSDELEGAAISSEAQEEFINAEMMAQLSLLDDTLKGEALDPGWTNDAITALETSVSQNKDAAIEVIDVDCGSSMCRMEIAFLPGEQENSLRQFNDLIPWNGEMFFQVEDVNTGEAVIYIARENYSLPRISD